MSAVAAQVQRNELAHVDSTRSLDDLRSLSLHASMFMQARQLTSRLLRGNTSAPLMPVFSRWTALSTLWCLQRPQQM